MRLSYSLYLQNDTRYGLVNGDTIDTIRYDTIRYETYDGFPFVSYRTLVCVLLSSWSISPHYALPSYQQTKNSQCTYRQPHFSPPGRHIAMPPAGIMPTIFFFFQLSPLSFDNGWTVVESHCGLLR